MVERFIIRARKIEKVYHIKEDTVHALDGVDIDVRQGQFVAITGQSGSGKSTLLHMLSGLDTPSDGQIMVAGHRLETLGAKELAYFRRYTIGFVFQSFYLIPSMSALENAALPGIFANIPRDERQEHAARLLTMLGLDDRFNHKPTELSGGQQQRVAIARSLFNNPPIIMGDEPTGALDSKTSQSIIGLLHMLSTKYRKTVVLVTHDPEIARTADRILQLKDGRIIADTLNLPETKSPEVSTESRINREVSNA
ncbi:MAG TPA: ABC transporter ATP-binding protein [Aggregatilineales bacterium]|nr:ABC transporter ATP-binding protein [Aggregatilineales bacterium]